MILDLIERLEISDEEVGRRGNELRAIGYLGEGLKFLANQVRKIEGQIQEREDPKVITFAVGNVPELAWVPNGLLACAFHWYAVSACNFARLVGFLAYDDAKQAGNYVERVMPTVHLWRNKVAAHFAMTDPRKDDTAADLAVSVMFPLAVDDGHLVTGGLTLTLGDGSTSRGGMGWSLTRNFEELSRRYPSLQ